MPRASAASISTFVALAALNLRQPVRPDHTQQRLALTNLAGQVIDKIDAQRDVVDIHENIAFRVTDMARQFAIKPVDRMLAVAAPVGDEELRHAMSRPVGDSKSEFGCADQGIARARGGGHGAQAISPDIRACEQSGVNYRLQQWQECALSALLRTLRPVPTDAGVAQG